MRILYVDESGDTNPLKLSDTASQPVLVVGSAAVDAARLESLTRQWVDLKKRFFPGLCDPAATGRWSWQTAEIKGTDLRRAIRQNSRRERRQAIGFLDRTFDLADAHSVRLASRVWIKDPGARFDGRAVYTSSVQWLCERFDASLQSPTDSGFVIADSRTPGPNAILSHSVFTQKFRATGDAYPRIIETPVFGHSQNHAGLQITDIVLSGVTAPICTHFFLSGRIANQHLHVRYADLAQRYTLRLLDLHARPSAATETTSERKALDWDLSVSDPVTKRGHMHLRAAYSAQ